MDFLPVFLDIKGKQCLIVGGGEVALRKAELLHRAGARLTVVAPRIHASLSHLLEEHGHGQKQAEFSVLDLNDCRLVVAASNDEQLNRRISELAMERGLPVNVVDNPDLCSVIFPSIVDRSPVLIAISTGGNSPVLARKIKEQIETLLPGSMGNLARLFGEFRPRVKERLADFKQRLLFWERVMESPVPELVVTHQELTARKTFEQLLDSAPDAATQGEVYLVGAGPGDPDLLTLRALRLMHKADVVLYDRLVTPEIMQRLRPDAEKIHVGKERAYHPVPQEQINQLLLRLAREGKRVLRLKGGDPFIFGRGGEEIELLMEHQIPFQVVPGITAASGCASYAGIPLTHREHSQAIVFLTGHVLEGEGAPDWEYLARNHHTLVFYMGLMTLSGICQQLIRHGMDAEMPAALIQQGTTQNQKVIIGNLENLSSLVAAAEVRAPTLLIIGRVVSLRERLTWFSPGN